MNEHDPPAFPGPDAPPVLGDALAAARAEAPSAAQIASLAARLPLGGSPYGGPSGAPPSVLSGALVGAALGVLVSGAAFLWSGLHEGGAATGAPTARVQQAETAGPAPEAAASHAGGVASASPRAADGAHARAPVAPPPVRSSSSSSAAPVEPAPLPSGAELSAPETEVHLLQRAQDALAASPAQALALTQEHAARFPAGVLGQEREVVAIQALLRMGRGGEAKARGARFVAAFPGSAHRRRLEALLGP